MTTEQELAKCKCSIYDEVENSISYRTTDDDMRPFMNPAELGAEISVILNEYADKNNIKPKYEGLSIIMRTNEKTIKRSVAGKGVSKEFLYKMVVGLGMSLEEANDLFAKSGYGILREDCREDLICIRAIQDHDLIEDFVKEFMVKVPGSKMKDIR